MDRHRRRVSVTHVSGYFVCVYESRCGSVLVVQNAWYWKEIRESTELLCDMTTLNGTCCPTVHVKGASPPCSSSASSSSSPARESTTKADVGPS